MKNKPSKWRYKVWMLAGTSGYIQNFQISCDAFISDSQVLDEIKSSGQVILELNMHLPSE